MFNIITLEFESLMFGINIDLSVFSLNLKNNKLPKKFWVDIYNDKKKVGSLLSKVAKVSKLVNQKIQLIKKIIHQSIEEFVRQIGKQVLPKLGSQGPYKRLYGNLLF